MRTLLWFPTWLENERPELQAVLTLSLPRRITPTPETYSIYLTDRVEKMVKRYGTQETESLMEDRIQEDLYLPSRQRTTPRVLAQAILQTPLVRQKVLEARIRMERPGGTELGTPPSDLMEYLMVMTLEDWLESALDESL